MNIYKLIKRLEEQVAVKRNSWNNWQQVSNMTVYKKSKVETLVFKTTLKDVKRTL